MDAIKIAGVDASKLGSQPFRFEPGDGTEPPRLLIDSSCFQIEDGKVVDLQNRVSQLETLVSSMRSDLLSLQARLESRQT